MFGSVQILQSRILIVDDKAANIILLEQILQGAGYVAIGSTMDPREVCGLHRQNRYDLILLDLEMPGMNGFQVMEGLKEIETGGYLPVLVITAQAEQKLRALRAGAKDFLSKPFDIGEVLVRVHNMLEVRLLHLEAGRRSEQAERSERGLRASELSYRRLFEAAKDGILILDVETGRITDVNPFLAELLGSSHADIVGQTVGDLSPFKDIESNKVMLERLQKDGYVRYENLPLETIDGRQIAVEFVCNVYQAGDKQVIQCNVRDITARQRAETALRESEERYHTLFEYAPDGILIADARSRYLDANANICRMLGYTRAELIGLHASDIVAQVETVHIEPALTAIKASADYHREWQFRRKDGSVFAAEVTATRMPGGNLLGMIRDITKRKDAEEEIHRLNQILERRVVERTAQLQTAYEGMRREIGEHARVADELKLSFKEIADLKSAVDEHAIVAITDPRGTITYVNDKFCAISQYSRTELLGQDHRLINSGHHPAEFIRDLWTTITGGRVWHGEIKNQAKDGSFYWVDTTIVPFLDTAGKPRQYVAIRADVTARKAVEESIVERTAQLEAANKELEAFSYSVSHDLRAPLRAVDGFSQAVIDDYGAQLPEEGRRYLQTIRAGAQRMGVLIDDLLTFARLSRQSLSKRAVDSGRLVREVLAELEGQRQGRTVEIQTGNLPPCQADRALLKQVWVNLLSNALKYTRKSAAAVVAIGCTREKDENVYFVRDNGSGFDMRYAHKLFGVFQRLHLAEDYEGTGVGLAIVQRIVHRHGGRVWADAAVGRGATFFFTLQEETKP